MSVRIRAFSVILLCLAFAGCGGSESDDAKATVSSFLEALADGDGQEACEKLTGAGYSEIVIQAVALRLPPFPDPNSTFAEMNEYEQTLSRFELQVDDSQNPVLAKDDCPEAVELISRERRDALQDLRFAEVTDVRLEGDTAFAQVEGLKQVVRLEKVDGEWRLAVASVQLVPLPGTG